MIHCEKIILSAIVIALVTVVIITITTPALAKKRAEYQARYSIVVART